MADLAYWEEQLKKAQTLDALEALYVTAKTEIKDAKELEKLYKAYEKRKTELLLQQYEYLKAQLEGRVKTVRKDKVNLKVKVTKKLIKAQLLSAEHYVAMLQQNKDGIQLLFLRKAKLVENQGYLMLEVKKLRKAWILTAEPLLLERQRLFVGKKFVAVHFVLPDFPYTLDVAVDEKLRQLTLKSLNAPQIMHAMIKTKFFEALARVGSGPDLMMLIVGVLMGLGFGLAIGFGIANTNLTHLLAPHTNTTATHSVNPYPTATSSQPSFTIPSKG